MRCSDMRQLNCMWRPDCKEELNLAGYAWSILLKRMPKGTPAPSGKQRRRRAVAVKRDLQPLWLATIIFCCRQSIGCDARSGNFRKSAHQTYFERCLKTLLIMYNAPRVNRLPSIATGGHGRANSAISVWCAGCSLPVVIAQESRRDRYALAAVTSCIYTVMTKWLCDSGARNILPAGRIRKFQKNKDVSDGSSQAPSDKALVADLGVNINNGKTPIPKRIFLGSSNSQPPSRGAHPKSME